MALSPDQIISASLVASGEASAVELLVGAKRVAITVETGPGHPNLRIGNTVVVIPTPEAAAVSSGMVEGTVVALQENFVTLAVAASDAPILASMIGSGPLVVALKGR